MQGLADFAENRFPYMFGQTGNKKSPTAERPSQHADFARRPQPKAIFAGARKS